MDHVAESEGGPGPGERGRELERRVADYLAAHGYEVERNVVSEGRSGARHEVDVLAERSDPAMSVRVAVECKAWAEPVTTEPIARLDWLVRDLALNKAVMVCPAGATPAATETARDLGVEIWGPDEIRTRLRTATPASGASGPEGLAWTPIADHEAAARIVRRERAGVLGLGREAPVAEGPCWLAWHALELGEPVREGVLRKRLRTQRRWVLYDALGAELVRPIDGDPAEDLERQVLDGRRLPISTTAERVVKAIRKAASQRDAVVSESAQRRHADRLEELGVDGDGAAPTIERRRLVWQPLWLAVLARRNSERVVAVDLSTGRRDPELEECLTGRAQEVAGQLTDEVGG